MEESLTLDELYLLMNTKNEQEHNHRKFLAALKGIDLDENKEDEDFESVRRRAEATLANKSENEYTLEQIGFEVESDD